LLAPVFPMIPGTTLRAALIAAVPVFPRIAAQIPVSSVRWLRALAGHVLGRTMEPPQLLAQRFDFALVGGLLALGQFQQFEHFIELVERLAERGNDLHHFIDGLADGLGMRRLGRAGRGWRRALLARTAHRRLVLLMA
jgi:hypothetical protein